MTREQENYARWYRRNREKKIAYVRQYRDECADVIKFKQHQAYLRRKAEGYYD